VRVTAAAGRAADPLSDRVLALSPELKTGLALAPPQGSADGEWTRAFAAPAQPGTYTWFLVAASEGCVPSDPVALTLTVQ
jgi:hypothetical protein